MHRYEWRRAVWPHGRLLMLRAVIPLFAASLFSLAAGATSSDIQSPPLSAFGTENVQSSSHILALFEEAPADEALLAGVERALGALTAYWGLDLGGLLAACEKLGLPSSFLFALVVYADWADMARDVDRFDVSGASLFLWTRFYAPFELPPLFEARLPLFVLTSDPSSDAWWSAVRRELMHVLQLRSWRAANGLTWAESSMLREGVAEWSALYIRKAAETSTEDRAVILRWLREGGTLERAPFYLHREIGVSLVERWIRLAGPGSVWATFSPQEKSTYPCQGLPTMCCPVDFPPRFLVSAGVTWTQFVADWAAEAQSASGSAFSEVLDRWKKDAFELRKVLLRPILRQETLAEFDSIAQRVAAGLAMTEDLDRAESLLQRAPEDGIDIDVEALTAREDTLAWYAVRVDEARNDMARVRSASELVRKLDRDPAEYARRFAHVVNAYVPAAVRLPLSEYEPPSS
ncbi:MAG: hypothetical protein ABFD77_08920 [Thermotogota bacterium]